MEQLSSGRNREGRNHRRHDEPRPRVVSLSDWELRAADNLGFSPAPLRRTSVVLRVPVTGGFATVLWKPPGAARFCSRQAWGRRVAYASQFLDRDSRAHHGQSKINSRLCSIGRFDPDDWNFPPKPKWMRWKTYNRLEQKFDRYEDILDSGIERLVAKLGGL